MSNAILATRFSCCLIITPDHLGRAIGITKDPGLRWLARSFCASARGCTLDEAQAHGLVHAAERLLRRYRAACDSECIRPIIASLEALFEVIRDPMERCLDRSDRDCVCSWDQRIETSEQLLPFLTDTAKALVDAGEDAGSIASEIDSLACLANELCEWLPDRSGGQRRFAKDDPCAAACADRLSSALFDAAEYVRCGDWEAPAWQVR